MVDFDRKRQVNREALNAIKEHIQPKIQDIAVKNNVWVSTGSMFIKVPSHQAKSIIVQGFVSTLFSLSQP